MTRIHCATKNDVPYSVGAYMDAQAKKPKRLSGIFVPKGACQCKYPGCGELLLALTYPHLFKHGYTCKEQFIADGHVEFFKDRE